MQVQRATTDVVVRLDDREAQLIAYGCKQYADHIKDLGDPVSMEIRRTLRALAQGLDAERRGA